VSAAVDVQSTAPTAKLAREATAGCPQRRMPLLQALVELDQVADGVREHGDLDRAGGGRGHGERDAGAPSIDLSRIARSTFRGRA
jgi:hypothetical protein